MPTPSAYLDECVDHNLVEALRAQGYSATSALEQGRANLGDEDDAQLAYATARGWMLITHNERHFRSLSEAYRQDNRPHGGIIVVPERPPFDRLVIRVAMMLDWVATMPEYRSGFFKWGHLQALLERGYRPTGYSQEDIERALGR